jgi:hypothetical protein
MGDELVMEHGPLMMAGGLLLLAGLMKFSTGLLGEVLIRTYFETQDRRIYAVRQILAKKERRTAGRQVSCCDDAHLKIPPRNTADGYVKSVVVKQTVVAVIDLARAQRRAIL